MKSTPSQRFWAKVDTSGDCWVWTAYVSTSGYGRINVEGWVQYAHRVAYRWAKGEIPAGLTVDHLCHNRLCMNVDHMELVTLAENIRRSGSPSSVVARTNVCQRGHDLSIAGNVRTRPEGRRYCVPCSHIRNRARYAA